MEIVKVSVQSPTRSFAKICIKFELGIIAFFVMFLNTSFGDNIPNKPESEVKSMISKKHQGNGALSAMGKGDIGEDYLNNGTIQSISPPTPVYNDSISISMDIARLLSVKRASQLWGGNPSIFSIIPINNALGDLIAYDVDMVIEGSNPISYASAAEEWRGILKEEKSELHIKIKNKEVRGAEELKESSCRFASLTISATFDAYPIRSSRRGISNFFASCWIAKSIAIKVLNSPNPLLKEIFYEGPWARAYRFESDGRSIVVEGQEPWAYYSFEKFDDFVNESALQVKNEIYGMISNNGLSPEAVIDSVRNANSIALNNLINEPPLPLSNIFIYGYSSIFERFEWHYGCSPTSGAMVLNYWENYSWYGKLNFWFYREYDDIEYDTDCHVAGLQEQMRIWMNTDNSGNTLFIDIYPGMRDFANAQGYSFSGGPNWYGSVVNWYWDEMVQEINSGYPFVFSASAYPLPWGGTSGHSVAAVGYDNVAQDLWVYTTWSTYGNSVQRVHHSFGILDLTHIDGPHPGGAVYYDAKLENPDGYQTFASCGYSGTYSGGDILPITWNNYGSPGDHVNIFYSTDGGINWNGIVNTADDEEYNWLIPCYISSNQCRILIQQFSSSSVLSSSDGSYGDFRILPGSSPNTPSNVAATDYYCDRIFVSWSDVANESGYRVYRNGQQVGGDRPANSTSYTDYPNPGTYSYRVSAFNQCGESSQSAPDNGTRLDVPSQVVGVNATDGDCFGVTIIWNDLSGESGYKVYRNGSQIGSTSANDTDYYDDDGSPLTTYDYTVKAYNSCGNGPESAPNQGYYRTIPGTPTISGPTSVCEGNTIQLNASASNGPTSWAWNAGCGGSFNPPNGTPTIWTPPSDYSGPCQISVVASNICGSSNPGQHSVNVYQVPSTPIISGPTNVCGGQAVQYSATASGGPTSWAWSSGCGGSFNPPNGTPTIWTPPSGYSGPCQISVVASNICGSSYPGLKSINVDQLPNVLSLISPPDGAQNQVQPVYLDWDDVSGSDYYQVQVDDNSDFSSPEIDSQPTASNYSASGLEDGVTYYWHVRAHNICGWGDYSPMWNFITIVAGPQIVIISPSQNQLNVPVNTNITVTFDSDMDPATISDSTFVVIGTNTGPYTGTITYEGPSRTMTFDPTEDFAAGELLTVILTDDIESGGVPLAQPYAWSFGAAVNGGAGTFAAPETYATGLGPWSVFAADLDGDGDLDLATANRFSHDISLFLNDGVGAFSSLATYTVGDYPRSIFAADLNGDGDLDLVTANSGSDNISVLLNNGDSTFAPHVTYTVGNIPFSIFASDFDGDSDLDLVTANPGSDNISVLLNDGAGIFTAETTYATGTGPYSVCSADVDNDSDLDLVTANRGSGDISVLLNNGNGTFASQMTYAVGAGPWSVFTSDLDGDGDLDLATVNDNSNDVSVLLNDGDGTFASQMTYAVGTGPWSVFASDLDGDGDLDLVTANTYSNDVSVLLNNGDATFAPQMTYAAGSGPRSVFASDLDGDGDLDLALADIDSDNISVLFNRYPNFEPNPTAFNYDLNVGDPNPADQVLAVEAEYASIDFAVTDDADWLAVVPDSSTTPDSLIVSVDIAGLSDGTYNGNIIISSDEANNSPQTVEVELILHSVQYPDVTSTSPTQNQLNVPVSTNITATFDSDMDPATINDSTFTVNGMYTGLYDGTITYDGPSRTAAFNPTEDFAPGELVTVVLTDGMESGGVPLGDPYVWSFITAVDGGAGIFGPQVTYPTDGGPNTVFASDLDGDGDLDLATANQSGFNVSVLLNDGAGNFADQATYAVGSNPYSMFAADLDGDGDIDLATANFTSNNISVLQNYGDGTFAPQVTYNTGTYPHGIFISDLNGDGSLDVVTANAHSNDVSILLNNGNGIFATQVAYGVAEYPQSVYASDFDGDGDFDLAAANSTSDNVSVLLNNGDGTFANHVTYNAGDGPWFVSSGDLDGDNDQELITANRFSGNISILRNNGDGTFAIQEIYVTGNTPYSVFVSDLDGDGDLDLASTNANSSNISVLMNNGNGIFAPHTTYAAGIYPFSVFASDLDGDGDLDLAAANWGSDNISVLFNRYPNFELDPMTFNYDQNVGDPNPVDQILAVEAEYASIDFAVTDDADWLTVAPDSGTTPDSLTVSVDITGLSGGTYAGNIIISSDEADNSPQTVEVELIIHSVQYPDVTSTSPTQNQLNVPINTIITVTFDSDMDPVTINDSTFVVNGMYTGLHAGTITYDGPSRTATFNPTEDFAPGEPVTVVLTEGIESGGVPLGDPYVWSFRAAVDGGAGVFASHITFPVGTDPVSIFASDLDNDRDLDLISANFLSNSVSILINDGTGMFMAETTYAVGVNPYCIFAADLDGDGDIDLATANTGSNNVSVLFNDGSGIFDLQFIFPVGVTPKSVFASDFDGDGKIDLATANSGTDDISVLLNHGDSSFTLTSTGVPGTDPVSIFGSDLDGDGDIDLTTANNGSNDISIFLNSGNGTFSPETTYSVGSYPYSVFAADLDGDGNLDLSTANSGSDDISVLLSNDDGSFSSQILYAVGNGPISIFAIDLDGDGDLDLSTANSGSNDVSILLNNADGTFTGHVLYSVGAFPYSVFSSDLDGDGDLDLAVADKNSDSVSILLNRNGDCEYVTGDVNGSDSYNGLDITYGVAFFKGGNDPFCLECPLCPNWWYCGDVNGSCSYNGLDITYGVSYFKGGQGPIACGDCPPAGGPEVVRPEHTRDMY